MKAGWAGALLALGVTHGGLAATAPVVGYPGSAPPLSSAGAVESALAVPTMGTWAQLPARLASPQGDSRMALEYVRWSRLLERQAEAGIVLRAISRKVHSPWLGVALAELAATPRAAADRRRPPRDPVARLHLDIRSATSSILAGEAERSLAPLGRVHAALATVRADRLPVVTRVALVRLASVVDPGRARAEAWALWRQAKRHRRRSLAAELQGILGAIGEGRSSRVLLEGALRGVQRGSGAGRVLPWLAQVADAGTTAGPVAGACHALPVDPAAHRFDCDLVGFERAWQAGRWAEAFSAYHGLDLRLSADLPAAQRYRAGLAVLPLLRVLGEWREFQRWHGVAVEAASLLRAPHLVDGLNLDLAGGLRVSGRYRQAAGVLQRVVDVEDPDIEARTLVERARLAWASGASAEARDLISRALLGARRASAGVRLATALGALDMSPRALSLEDMQWLQGQVPSGPVSGALWRALVTGRQAESQGRWEAAGRQYDRAWRLLRKGDRATVEQAIVEVALRRRIAERRAAVGLVGGDPRSALRAVEAGRATVQPGEARWRHLAVHTGRQDLVLVYARVDDGLWLWKIDRGRVSARVVSRDAETVLALARMWTAALERGGMESSWQRIGKRLGEVLLAPAMRAGWARGKHRLLVAPAAGLEEVPFDVLAELVEGGAGLVRGGVVTAASMGALDTSWHRSRPAGEAVVFVPRSGSASLAEARIVGAALGGRLFLGRDATKDSFRRSAPGASIVHFGGHSEAPGTLLGSGGLTLRPLASSSGILGYREIAELELAGAVVVLLGCDTAAVGPTPFNAASHGVSTSLTNAFLRAGTRAVVGNLWSIDDSAARDLAMEFYAAGGPAAGPSALALTKRRLRDRHPHAPARWAGIVWQGAPPH